MPQIASEVRWSSIPEGQIFDPILDAMSKIRTTNVQPKKIVLTPKRHTELMSLKRMNCTTIINFVPTDPLSIANVREDYTPRTTLWGADIVIGNECAVYSDDQFTQSKEMINFLGYHFRGLTIIVKSRASLLKNITKEESTAIETLREMISETDFRRYIKYGFVLVKGKSGDIYQVPRSSHYTNVWRNGKLIEKICVRIADSKIPLTDNVIAFKTIIETDENEFKKLGNVHKMVKAA